MEKSGVASEIDDAAISPHSLEGGDKEALNSSEIDILEVTTESPYKEINFWGSFAAVTLSAASSFGGFVLPATSLALINADIGPSPNIIWVALAWTIALAVGSTIVGRFSDIFGRRWYCMGATVVAIVGHAIGATAHGVNQVIAAHVFIGLAASAQQAFNYIIAELVPMKHRFYWMSLMYAIILPIAGFGAYFSRLFIVNTTPKWRWDYYFFIILNFVAFFFWFLFYHPPKFGALHRNRSKLDELRDIDYGGIVLYAAGLILFCLGISWGGVLYPWNSAHVIATTVVGGLTCVAFVLYEIYMPLGRPIIPMSLFTSTEYSAVIVITTVGGMMYFSINVIYPNMVAVLFTQDVLYGGLLVCSISAATVGGQMTGAFIAVPGGHMREKLIFCSVLMTAFIGGLSGVGQNKAISTVLVALGSFSVGLIEGLTIGLVTVVVDQKMIGVAGGVFGSIRTVGGVISTTIFSTILSNKISDYTSSLLVPDVIEAGLPTTSVEPFLIALNSGNVTLLGAVPGVTERIIEIGAVGLKEVYSKSYSLVYFASISFGGLAIIAAFFCPNIEDRLTHDVVRRLNAKPVH